MVVVLRSANARVCVMVPYGLEAREGVREYADPLMFREGGEGRVYGDQLRSHDGAGLLRSRRINVDSGGGGYVYHRRS